MDETVRRPAVLILEDDMDARELLETTLEMADLNIEIISCHRGKEVAERVLKTRKGIAIALLDMYQEKEPGSRGEPIGAYIFSTLQSLCGTEPENVAIISGKTELEIRTLLQRIDGGDQCTLLPKPFNPDRVIKFVQDALARLPASTLQ